MVILKCQKQKVMVMLKFTHSRDFIVRIVIFIPYVSVVEGNDWKYVKRSLIYDFTVSSTHFLEIEVKAKCEVAVV